jgi:hypothetical protein
LQSRVFQKWSGRQVPPRRVGHFDDVIIHSPILFEANP